MILILRASRRTAEHSGVRRRSGDLEWIELPVISLKPIPGSGQRLGDSLSKASGLGVWVLFTSANTVRMLFGNESAPGTRSELKGLAGKFHIAAVGTKTCDALKSAGLSPALLPKRANWEGLAEALGSKGATTVVWPNSSASDRSLTQELQGSNVEVIEINIYEEVTDVAGIDEALKLLSTRSLSGIGFASVNTVRTFVGALEERGKGAVDEVGGAAIGAIGESTASALRSVFPGRPVLVPSSPDVESLVLVLTEGHPANG